jgi:DMSO/TMAO reductase YedYZ molybdopterin-dependent catalytic subunit
VLSAAVAPDYRLVVSGRASRPLSLDLSQVLALPRSSSVLPIACVEGWSYSARWEGVRLRDLLDLAGAPTGASATVASLERSGAYRTSMVDRSQAEDPATLLATHLDGKPLSLDHGYPLRLIAPDRAGVLQTKWVTEVVVR